MSKTYGELFNEIDPNDQWFEAFCRGWDAAVKQQDRNGRIDPSEFSEIQKAQLWAFYTDQSDPS